MNKLQLFFLILILSGLLKADDAKKASGFNNYRIDNEYRLMVPLEKTQEVRSYLEERFKNDDNFFLKKYDKNFTTIMSDEYFSDVYFDTPEFDLLDTENSIRKRTRAIPENPNHPKHGRSLIQMKLKRADDKDTNRGEIKFPVSPISKQNAMKDVSPIFLVPKKFKEEIVQRIEEVGVNPYVLRPTLVINQRRWRIYVYKENKPFATITLDEYNSSKYWVSISMTDVELELNEIKYTEGDAEFRAKMQVINELLKYDLLNKFSYLKIDAVPKYNKMFYQFEKKIPFFRYLLRII